MLYVPNESDAADGDLGDLYMKDEEAYWKNQRDQSAYFYNQQDMMADIGQK